MSNRARTLLAMAVVCVALPASAAECPQERAIYSLGDATFTFEPDPDNMYTKWSATLRAPTAPVHFRVVASNGVVKHYFRSETGQFSEDIGAVSPTFGSEIELLDARGRFSWGEAGKPANPSLRLSGFGPKGTWRLTGCAKP